MFRCGAAFSVQWKYHSKKANEMKTAGSFSLAKIVYLCLREIFQKSAKNPQFSMIVSRLTILLSLKGNEDSQKEQE